MGSGLVIEAGKIALDMSKMGITASSQLNHNGQSNAAVKAFKQADTAK
jgi:hypothetical protein